MQQIKPVELTHFMLNPILTERYKSVIAALDFSEFEIPRGQEESTDDFPSYLKKQLARYATYYHEVLMPLIEDEDGMPFGEGKEMDFPALRKSLHEIITLLIAGINQTIEYHYNGRLFEANKTFRETLDSISFPLLTSVSSIPAEYNFYRTRYQEGPVSQSI